MPLTRRQLLTGLAASAALSALPRSSAATRQSPAEARTRLAAVPGLQLHGDEQIALLLYPGFTALDLVGPHYFFACLQGAKVHLVTNQPELQPVPSDLGLSIVPTCTLQSCPADLTVLFAPGGTAGTVAAMEDPATRSFLADRASRARYITSVCTGSMLLGAAGLLRGRRATSHWVTHPVLADFGATPVEARVVSDGPVITAAGVSAGLDFALTVVAALRGRPYAETLMLQAEYAPAPPFPGGTPASTNPAVADPLADLLAPIRDRMRATARKLQPATA